MNGTDNSPEMRNGHRPGQPSGRFFALLLAAVGAASAFHRLEAAAVSPGDEVVVVYNEAAGEDSRKVAEHYAAVRGVATNRIIGLSLPTTEAMTRPQFLEQLQKPLLQELESRRLLRMTEDIVPAEPGKPGELIRRMADASFRYLVLCYGVPVRILPDANLSETETNKVPAEMRRNDAAVDSELAALPLTLAKPFYSGAAKNPFYMTTEPQEMKPSNGLLMTARLDGPTPEIARQLVDRALQAETNGLWGYAYFDTRGLTNGSYLIGDDWLREAIRTTRRQGFETVVDEQPTTFPPGFPLRYAALYAGWYDGTVSGPFAQPSVEFMPGAVAYHLHSFSAATLRSATANWVGPLLAKGAAATMGAVQEPFLAGTPDLGVFFSRLIAQRFTFGEAAYASQSTLSWMITVVGDPLYRPMGQDPQTLHQKLEAAGSSLVEWSHLRVVNLNLAIGTPPGEMVKYLREIPQTTNSAVLTQKVGDLLAAQGQGGEALAEYSAALQRHPSPQHRIYLQLALARYLRALNRPADALAQYKAFLTENPKHPYFASVAQEAETTAKAAGVSETPAGPVAKP